jgi:hypothetical protein
LEVYESEQDDEAQRLLLYARCATDRELYSHTFFPHYCTHPFNDFHLEFFEAKRFMERSVRRLRVAPRGNAKSTHLTHIDSLHDVCYGQETFIVFLSNTSPLAERKLKNLRDEVINNHQLREFYGLHFPKKNPAETQFTILNGEGHSTLFMAFGKGAQIRGVTYGAERPSKLVFDDVEHSDEVHNEQLRQKDADWALEDAAKTGNELTNIQVVGTMLHRDSLLAKFMANPVYEGKIFKSVISWSEREDLWDIWRKILLNIDDRERRLKADAFYREHQAEMLRGTKVLWPEKEPYEYLMRELLEIGKRAFFKEKQNEPLGSEDKVFEKIHWYREIPEGLQIEETGLVIPWGSLKGTGIAACDPATGQTKPKKGKLGDFTCIPSGYVDGHGRVLVHNDWTKRAGPSSFIRELFELEERWGFNRIGVEMNLYRDVLLDNLKEEKKRQEEARYQRRLRSDPSTVKQPIELQFYEVTQTESKTERIFRLEPKVNNGWILFNRALSSEFKRQMEDFPHADNDDCCDALEILWNVAHNVYRPGGVALNPMHR